MDHHGSGADVGLLLRQEHAVNQALNGAYVLWLGF
nr:hypothetical protein [Massilia horti]